MEAVLIGIFVVVMVFIFIGGMFVFPELFGISKNKRSDANQENQSEHK